LAVVADRALRIVGKNFEAMYEFPGAAALELNERAEVVMWTDKNSEPLAMAGKMNESAHR
jgi:hypothetical protein